MFGLFKSATRGIKVIDKVWMSKQAKWNACAGMYNVNPDCLFIAWFENTFTELQQVLNLRGNAVNLLLARDLDVVKAQGRMVVFAEHYPVSDVEQGLFRQLNLKEVPVLSSLDEPLFLFFGGENTIELMKKLGMKEDEMIGHSMITKSIHKAQEKIAKNSQGDASASSQKEWLSINMNKSRR